MTKTILLKGVTDAEKVYNDTLYGLDSVQKVYYWVLACKERAGGAHYTAIMNHLGLTAS